MKYLKSILPSVFISIILAHILNKNNNLICQQQTINPIQGYITSYFGYRIHPITGNLDFHPAIDISAPFREEIRSILSGKVKETGSSDIYGNYIIISHKNDIESKYCHCDQILISKNNKVFQGQVIAVVGHTGLATGSHLHLETKIKNIKVDPLLLVSLE